MHRAATFACSAMLVVTAAGSALAQDAERYQLERTENGYVRLDTTTGRMSLCEQLGERLVCRTATEEREADDHSSGKLEDRIAVLEGRVAELEKRGTTAEMPSEEEFEQTLGYMERFFRRFMGIVTDLERRNEPEAPPADRT